MLLIPSSRQCHILERAICVMIEVMNHVGVIVWCSCRVPVRTCGSLRVPAFRRWCSRLTPSQASCTGTPSGNWGPCCWTAAWQWGRPPLERSGGPWTHHKPPLNVSLLLYCVMSPVQTARFSLTVGHYMQAENWAMRRNHFCECHHKGHPINVFVHFPNVLIFSFPRGTVSRGWFWMGVGGID